MVFRVYQGMLVHHLVLVRRTGRRLKRFLKTDEATVKQYRLVLSVVHQLRTRRPRLPEGERRAQRRQPGNALQLLYEDEDALTESCSLTRVEEELQLDDQLMVKTRFRTKERRNRCNKVELTRKEERRGVAVL